MATPLPYFRLFACCLLTRGARRSTICDVQRGELFFISNNLEEILGECRNRTYDQILLDYEEEDRPTIASYFDFLLENELGFWTDDPTLFPDIGMEWDAPALITNAIIDSDQSSRHDFSAILSELEAIGCKDVQLRFYDEYPPHDLEKIVESCLESRIKSFDIIVKYSPGYQLEWLKALTEQHFRIKTITLHSAPHDEIVTHNENFERSGMGNILFVRQAIDSDAHCGIVSASYFVINNLSSFTEAKQYNSCLNRKVGIDVRGNIKNCPSLPTVYGQIGKDSLFSVANQLHFQELWSLHKDQISVCKDCEFRYVCTDCRAYTSITGDLLSKPMKCSYDPYTATWVKSDASAMVSTL